METISNITEIESAAAPDRAAASGAPALEASPESSATDSGASPRRMELLAPAGGMEQLEYAINFGADAVYLALDRFGMRRRAENFTAETLPEAVAYAHAHGVKVHVTANIAMHNHDIDELPGYFALLRDAGVDAAIISDMGALAVARETAPGLELHLSTQASCMNWRSALEWYRLGVKRIVCAREMSLAEIREMRRRAPADLEIEAFVHGAMCMAVSGRCIISDHLNARPANRGHCTQPCRWNYALVEESRPGEFFPVEQDGATTNILSSRDMNMLSHLAELAEAGVDSIKIEGRAKGTYYVAMVTNAYRSVLDGAPADAWQPELEAVSHRAYSTGFYFGYPGQTGAGAEYASTHLMVAFVTACEPLGAGEGYLVSAVCRNRIFEGCEVEAVSPGSPVRRIRIHGLTWQNDGRPVPVDVANRTMETYTFVSDGPLAPKDILRIPRKELP